MHRTGVGQERKVAGSFLRSADVASLAGRTPGEVPCPVACPTISRRAYIRRGTRLLGLALLTAAAGWRLVDPERARAASARAATNPPADPATPRDPDRPRPPASEPLIATVRSTASMVCTNFAAHPNEVVHWDAPVVRVVNVGTDPDARLGILLQLIHKSWCPVCLTLYTVPVVFDYFDPARLLLVQIRPTWEVAAGGPGWKAARLRELTARYAGYDVRLNVVFGYDEMIDTYLGGAIAVALAQQDYARRIGQADGIVDLVIAPSVATDGW